MNTVVIKELFDKSLAGAIAFPQVVAGLVAEGLESYHVDLVRGESRYYTPAGESHVQDLPAKYATAATNFSAASVEAAVRKSQAGKIKDREFIDQILQAGCVYYVTYLKGKRVTYFGRNGDFHTEHFPAPSQP